MSTSTNGNDGYRQAARRIREELRFHSGWEGEGQLREDWPRLWEAIDDLVRLVDHDDPREVTSPRLFDPPT